MQKYLAKLMFFFFALTLFLSSANAMELPFDKNIMQVISQVLIHCDVQTIGKVSSVSRSCSLSAYSDELWRVLYFFRFGLGHKKNPALSYKENYKDLSKPILCCFINGCAGLAEHTEGWDAKYNLTIDIDTPPTLPSVVEFKEIWMTELDKWPQLLFTNISPMSSLSELMPLALQRDVLVIAPVQNSGSPTENYSEIHELYPNLILVTASATAIDGSQQLARYAGYGTAVDMAALGNFNEKDGNSVAVCPVAEACAYMRSIRPDLSARHIRDIIVQTAAHSEETKDKIPNGGILDTARAVKYCENGFEKMSEEATRKWDLRVKGAVDQEKPQAD